MAGMHSQVNIFQIYNTEIDHLLSLETSCESNEIIL